MGGRNLLPPPDLSFLGMYLQTKDVSKTLNSSLHSYPGDQPFHRRETRSLSAGDYLNLSDLSMSSHSGTHVDAPYHFVADGKTIDEMPPDSWSGPALVFETSEEERVGSEALSSSDLKAGEILLLKTMNSSRWQEEAFFEDYTYLDESGARWLVNQGAKAVGIDYLSIEGFHVEGHPVHRLLLSSHVGIIEGLDLSSVKPGRYAFVCHPIKVGGGDGAPARALLMKGSG